MEQLSVEQIIQQDMEKIYLGNLNTVEFDLCLPDRGSGGTSIRWVSDNDNFLKTNGKVTRPMHGIGDRKVLLKAVFSYQGVEKEKIYEVHILEEPNQVQVISAFPLERTISKGTLYEFPQAVVVKAVDGECYSRHVDWEGGSSEVFEECGIYHKKGKIKQEFVEADLIIQVVEQHEVERDEEQSKVDHEADAFDSGETQLAEGSVLFCNQERALTYFRNIDADQMLYNFRQGAGVDTLEAKEMNGWDSPKCWLRGHTTGHLLSALALCCRETGDEEIKKKLNYLVKELKRCQDIFSKTPGFKEGYLGAYSEEQFNLLEQGVPYPDIWAPYYTLHKILAGLLDTYHYTNNTEALETAKRVAIWAYNRLSRLSKSQREGMWDAYISGEYGGMNESMARLYLITKDSRFLECARMFDNDYLFVPMEEKKDVLDGIHANQHIPQIIGCMEMYEATGEKRYYEMALYFWEIVTKHHIYANGGAGENEMFYSSDCIGKRLTQDTTELCASYNMLKLTKRLFQFRPKAFFMDYYERAMLNHVAASFDDEATGESTYFYPLIPGAVKQFRFQNSCCHGTGMESQMKYAENIYWYAKDAVYVNLFINSSLVWNEGKIKITQTVKEAAPGNIVLKVEGEGNTTLKIRKPYWCEGMWEVKVNNGKILAKCDRDGYINIQKTRFCELIEITFPCKVRVECTKDVKSVASLAYGPYVMAAVSGQKEYLELTREEVAQAEVSIMKENTEEKLTIRILAEELKDIIWIPLNHIKKQQYHVYWKLK